MGRDVEVDVAVAVDAEVRVVVLRFGDGPHLVHERQRFGEVCERLVQCREVPSSERVQPGTWGRRWSISSRGKVGVPGRQASQRWDVRLVASLRVVIVIILQVSADSEAVAVEVFDYELEDAVLV